MEQTLLEYKCPACGGALAFDPNQQKLKCPYCDTEFETELLQQLQASEQAQPQEDMSWQRQDTCYDENEAQGLASYVCKSCGGELVTDASTAATSCPYCGNPVVMSQNVTGQLRPDCIIPFKLDKQAAIDALKKHLTGKILLPKVFKDENHIREIKGVYVPFWLYDATSDGNARFHATKVRTWADSRYYYRETSHYRADRAGELCFSGVPVDGSSKMADELMESLEPFDLSQAVDFQSPFLAGYYADRYDVSAQDCADRANGRIRTSTLQALQETVTGYSTVTQEQGGVSLHDSKIRYALYPVWLLHTRYRDTDYLFAMNGQTGKFVGDLPMDKGAYWKWWFLTFAIAGAIAALVAWLAGYL